jgi:hypothetical protein
MTSTNGNAESVKIVDVNMPFGSMVVFMVKWAIASIPALLILWVLGLLLGGIAFGMFRAATA